MPEAAGRLPAAGGTQRFAAKQEAILAAAARRFNDQGLKGATLAEIAADVALSTTSLTYYYRRKEDLAVACLLRAVACHQAVAEQAWAAGGGPAERVRAFMHGEAALKTGQDEGRLPTLIEFNDIRAVPEGQSAQVFGAYTGLFRAVRRLLQADGAAPTDGAAPVARTALPPPAARAACNARAHLLLSTAHGLRHWLNRHDPDEHPRVADRAADLVLHGLGGAGGTWPGPALRHLPQPAPAATAAEAFLRAATELVNEQGYRGASVTRIAARLQLTKGAFYHHHDTKQDVVSACFDRSHDRVRQVLRAATHAYPLGWHRLCAAGATLVQLQLAEQGALLRDSAVAALPEAGARTRVRRQAQRLTERLVGLLVDGMADGSVRPLDPSLAARWLSTSINAAAELPRWVPDIDAEQAVAVYARPALMGLLVHGA